MVFKTIDNVVYACLLLQNICPGNRRDVSSDGETGAISSMLRPVCHPCGLLLRFRVPEGAERLAVSWRVSHYMILWTSAGANIRWRVHLPFGFLTLKMWDTCQNCRPRGAEQSPYGPCCSEPLSFGGPLSWR